MEEGEKKVRLVRRRGSGGMSYRFQLDCCHHLNAVHFRDRRFLFAVGSHFLVLVLHLVIQCEVGSPRGRRCSHR